MIDTNIVEMQFNNKQFESGVADTISSIDKLKQSLIFSEQKNEMESLEKTSLNSLESISVSFSNLEVIAVSVISNIATKAVEAGIQITKSLSIDNISAGWQRYVGKNSAVATLQAQGYNIDEINKQLNKLNWYTDETSYRFADMANNIAKFTAAGQNLEDATNAMMGIANWAALSGQNAETASRAMYNLAHAMSMGTMTRYIYRTIQTANMDTMEFKQNALDAAVALGTLQKNADGTYVSLMANNKKGRTPFNIEQFADYLTYGDWFTSDVQMATYKKYASAVEPLYDYYVETGSIASEGLEDLSDELDPFGTKAFRAAWEARSLSDAIGAVQEAVGTSWMVTFEKVFGDYNQSVILWTQLCNELYDLFVEGRNVFNDALDSWNKLGGRMEFLQGLWNILHNIFNVVYAAKDAFDEIFPPATADRLYDITEAFKAFTEKIYLNDVHLHTIQTIFEGIFAAIDIGRKVLISVAKGLYPIIEPLKEIGYYVEAILYVIAKSIVQLDKGIDELNVLDFITNSVANALNKLLSLDIGAFFSFLASAGMAALSVIGNLVSSFVFAVGELIHLDLSSIFDGVLDSLSSINFGDINLIELFDDIISSASEFSSEFIAVISLPFEILYDGISNIGNELKNKLQNILGVETISFSSIVNSIRLKIVNAFAEIKLSIYKQFESVSNILEESGITPTNISKWLLAAFAILIQFIQAGAFAKIAVGIKNLTDSLSQMGSSITGVLDSVRDCFKAYQNQLKAAVLKSIAKAILMLTVSLIALSTLNPSELSVGLFALGSILAGFTIVATKIVGLTTTMTKLKNLKVMIEYLRSISAAVLMMTISLRMISVLETEQMITGLAGTLGLMTGVVAVIAVVSNSISKLSDVEKVSIKFLSICASMLLIVSAINLLTPTLIVLGTFSLTQVIQGAAVIGGILLGLSLIINAISKTLTVTESVPSMAARFAVVCASIMLISASINLILPSIIALGAIKPEMAGQGFVVVFGIMSSMILFILSMSEMLKRTVNVTGVAATVVALGFSMIELSTAVNALVPALMILGVMPFLAVQSSMLALLEILTEFALFFIAISKFGTPAGGASILALSVSINILVPAISSLMILAAVDFNALEISISALFKILMSLMIFFIGIQLPGNPITGAATVLALSVSLIPIVETLSLLGNMAPDKLRNGLLGLLGILSELTIFFVGLSASPNLPMAFASILSLGLVLTTIILLFRKTALLSVTSIPFMAMLGSVLVFAKGMAVIGPKLLTAAPGMLAFAGTMAALGIALSMFNTATLTLGASVGVWIPALIEISNHAKELGEAIVNILNESIIALEKILPGVVRLCCDLILALIQGVLESLAVFIEPITIAILEFTLALIDAFKGRTAPILEALVSLAFEIIVALVEILAVTIKNDGQKLLAALLHVVDSIYLLLAHAFGADSDKLEEYLNRGREIIKKWTGDLSAFIGGIVIALAGLALAFSGFLGTTGLVVGGIIAVIAIFYTLQKCFGDVGNAIVNTTIVITLAILAIKTTLITGLLGGIIIVAALILGVIYVYRDKIAKYCVDGWVEIINYFKGLWEDMKEIGEFIFEGLVDGIIAAKDKVVEAATWIAEDIVNRFKKLFQIESPSKVMYQIGEYLDEGLENGITDGDKKLSKTMRNIGNNMLESFRDVVGVHSESTETHSISGFMGLGLMNGLKEKAPEIYSVVESIADGVMNIFGLKLDGDSLAKDFMGDFQNGLVESTGPEFTSEAAKRAYERMLNNALSKKSFGSTESEASIAAAQIQARKNAEKRNALIKGMEEGKLNNSDLTSIADSIIAEMDESSTLDDVVAALKKSELFDTKQIQEYVEMLKSGNGEMSESISDADSTEVIIDPLQAALERARELSSKFSEAKKEFDEIYGYYKDDFLNINDFTVLYGDILSSYPEVHDKLLEYINSKLGTGTDAALEAAKKMSERVSEAEKAFDEIYGYYKNGYLSKEDFDRLLNNMYTKYSDINEIFTKYVYDKMGGLIDDALDAAEKVSERQSEAKKKLDTIFDYYSSNLITDEDMERIISKWINNYSDIADYANEYLTEKMESIDDKIITSAKKQSERLDNFKSKFDEIFSLYQKNLISFSDFEKTSRDLVTKYADLGNDTIEYINEKILDSDNNRLEEATSYFDKIYDYYKDGLISWEEFEKAWTEIVRVYSDKRAKLLEYAGSKMIDAEYDKFSALFELYNSGIITYKMFLDEMDKLYEESIDGGAQLKLLTEASITENIVDELSDLSDIYKDKLDDIINNIEEFAEKLHISLNEAFDIKDASEEIKNFSDKVHTSFADSFTTKTNKEIYDENVDKYEKKLDSLNSELEETSEKFGSTSLMADYYRKQIEKVTKEYDDYKKSYEKSGLKDDDIAEVSFGADIEKELKEVEEYNSELDKLKVRGMNDYFYEMLSEKGREEGLAIVKYLNGLSDEEFKAISDKYDKLSEASTNLASNLYSDPDSVFKFKNNLKTELSELKDFKSNLDTLISKGVLSDDMLNYIRSLDRGKASSLVKGLLTMSNEEIEEIQNDWATIEDLAKETASTSFENDVKNVHKEYIDDIVDLYSELPEDMKDIGYRTIMSFTEGVKQGTAESISKLTNVAYTAGISSKIDASDEFDKLEIDNQILGDSIAYKVEETARERFESPEYRKKIDEALTKTVNNIRSLTSGDGVGANLLSMLSSGKIEIYIDPDIDLEIKDTIKPVTNMNNIPYAEDMLNAPNSFYKNFQTYIGLMNMSAVGEHLADNRTVVEDIRDKMDDLSYKFDDTISALSEAKIVMDAGRIASQLTDPMNGSLGRLVIQRSR